MKSDPKKAEVGVLQDESRWEAKRKLEFNFKQFTLAHQKKLSLLSTIFNFQTTVAVIHQGKSHQDRITDKINPKVPKIQVAQMKEHRNHLKRVISHKQISWLLNLLIDHTLPIMLLHTDQKTKL